MRAAAVTARMPTADPAVLSMLIDDLGPWLAAEYTATYGEKAPRPITHRTPSTTPPTEPPSRPATSSQTG